MEIYMKSDQTCTRGLQLSVGLRFKNLVTVVINVTDYTQFNHKGPID